MRRIEVLSRTKASLRFRVLLLSLSTVLLGASTSQVYAGRRLALVVANSSYSATPKLMNPSNDGSLVVTKLEELGFVVRYEKDLDAQRFANVIEDFKAGLDKDTDALFYYAGHGLQFDGENYFVGVNATLRNESALQFEAYRLNKVINFLDQSAGTTLVFWDACRNNPLAEELARSLSAARVRAASDTMRSGAAPLPPRRGDTLVVFSAEPGKVALDGRGKYSPFAEALGRHMTSAGIEIESMLKRVTADVLTLTDQVQKPERLSQLTRDFYFNLKDTQSTGDDDELRQLRAKLAALEQQQAPRRRFRVVTMGDGGARLALSNTTRDVSQSGAAKPVDAAGSSATAPRIDTQNTPVARQAPVVASSDGTVEEELIVAVNHTAAAIIRRIRVSPDGLLVAIGDDEGWVRLMRLDTLEVVRAFSAHAGRISDIDFSPDSATLLTAGRDGAVRYWDVKTGTSKAELREKKSLPYSARINQAFPDRWLLMGDKDGRLVAWDLKKKKVITNAKFHNGPVNAVAYQPGGKGLLLSAGGDGELKKRFPDGKRESVRAHNGAVFSAGYSATGQYFYSVGTDRKLKIWRSSDHLQEGPVATLEGHLKYVLTADISMNEALIASGGGDKSVNVWDVKRGELVGRLQGHTGDIESVAFTPDSKFIISASEDQSVKIWSVETKEEIATVFFERNSSGYVGVTLDHQSFGTENPELITVYLGGREQTKSDAAKLIEYLGSKITIVDQLQ